MGTNNSRSSSPIQDHFVYSLFSILELNTSGKVFLYSVQSVTSSLGLIFGHMPL